MDRMSGIFLHPTSLPSPFGIGDLGDSATQWIDLLVSRGQRLWQMCPLGPTGYGDSPYQSLSTFAGNTLLISPVQLMRDGLLKQSELDEYPALSAHRVDFGAVIHHKEKLFQSAFTRFADTAEFLEFCERERFWLDDYALYRSIKESHDGQPWFAWKNPYKLRFPAALADPGIAQRKAIRYRKFLQFQFYRQWSALRTYANGKGVKIIGDIPYYVAYDSADAWSAPDLFEFDEAINPTRVAGVPPDYFSETGQRWGNPLYRWDVMRDNGYLWWVERMRKGMEMFDYIRLDHFRGFESYWAISADCPTAIEGEWVKGPGLEFFSILHQGLGALPIIAEDLGDITSEVIDLRRQAGLPGIKVLQFAFDGNAENPYLPYNVMSDTVFYTGTHDNNTSLGWFQTLDEPVRRRTLEFLGCTEQDFLERFLRTVWSATSQMCVVPFQDILGLGAAHRMNTPGVGGGNWQWRFTNDMVGGDRLSLLEHLTRVYGRFPAVKSATQP